MKYGYFLLLTALLVSSRAANGAAQQPDNGPNWADTSAWIKENITRSAQYGYSWTESDTYIGSGLAHGNVMNSSGTEHISFQFNPNNTCHLNFKTNDHAAGDSFVLGEIYDGNVTDLDLSKSGPGSITIKPFDLKHDTEKNQRPRPNSDYIYSFVATPDDASYWEITGLYFTDANGRATEYSDEYASVAPLLFTDQSMATRVATALNHAAAVCGGKPVPVQIF